MSFEKFLKEIIMPASTLSPMAVVEDKPRNSFKNDKNNIFPSDEEIENVVNIADKAFWKTVIELFKDKVESKTFNFNKEIKELNIKQKEAVKAWIKDNWSLNKTENKKPIEFKPSQKSFEPPGTPSAGSEARI